MTTIQQVLFELETDYMGHPYYLTGHALYTALARRVDAQARRSLNVSTGVFVPWRVRGHTRSHIRTTGMEGSLACRSHQWSRTRMCSCVGMQRSGGCWTHGHGMRTTRTTSRVMAADWRLHRRLTSAGRPSIGTASGRCTGTSTATCTPMGRRGRPPAFRGCTGWAACRRGSKLRVR